LISTATKPVSSILQPVHKGSSIEASMNVPRTLGELLGPRPRWADLYDEKDVVSRGCPSTAEPLLPIRTASNSDNPRTFGAGCQAPLTISSQWCLELAGMAP
jgi:hypothetical protein